jgi:hypothetical protein
MGPVPVRWDFAHTGPGEVGVTVAQSDGYTVRCSVLHRAFFF